MKSRSFVRHVAHVLNRVEGPELWDELVTNFPGHVPLHLARLQALDNSKVLGEIFFFVVVFVHVCQVASAHESLRNTFVLQDRLQKLPEIVGTADKVIDMVRSEILKSRGLGRKRTLLPPTKCTHSGNNFVPTVDGRINRNACSLPLFR